MISTTPQICLKVKFTYIVYALCEWKYDKLWNLLRGTNNLFIFIYYFNYIIYFYFVLYIALSYGCATVIYVDYFFGKNNLITALYARVQFM